MHVPFQPHGLVEAHGGAPCDWKLNFITMHLVRRNTRLEYENGADASDQMLRMIEASVKQADGASLPLVVVYFRSGGTRNRPTIKFFIAFATHMSG